MRDVFVTVMIFASLVMVLKRPYIGILVWSWLSYMNPHKLTWGFAYDLPFAQIGAITFFASLLINQEKLKLPQNFTIYCMILFLAWMLLTSIMGFYPDNALDYYLQVLKIQLFTFLTIAVIKDLKQLNQLIVVITLSIGFFSIKGGIFTILTGGGFKVWGPPTTMIEENNALAVATLIIIPLMYYLKGIADTKLKKYFWLFAMIASSASALGSQSRGAMVSILAVGLFFWLKSSSKLLSGIVIIVLATTGYQFMPDSWHERMSTTINYEEDASANSRLDAWQFNFNLANSRLTGGGFKKDSEAIYAVYFGEVSRAYVAHSIYFSTLGDHGWFGLLLFLLIFFITWWRLSAISRSLREYEDTAYLSLLARMLQVSLVAYASGGLFLNLAHFDLPWHIVAIAMVLELITKQWKAEQQLKKVTDTAPKVNEKPRGDSERLGIST